MEILQRLKEFFKRETVLSIALLLAIGSAFVIPPDRGYVEYIDFRTLAILFCLMSIMAGLQKNGVFQWIAEVLLKKVKGSRQLVMLLVFLCFFFSMIITNDVSLILFVPFTFIVLKLLGEETKRRLLIPVVVMQTIAANLGSMLTPIGNPQNLYLYGKANLSLGKFLMLMLPYTAAAFIMLFLWCLIWGGDKRQKLELGKQTSLAGKGRVLFLYLALFVLCLLTVSRMIPYDITLVVVFAVIFLIDKEVLAKVDYALLFTFVGFFIFIGNMGRVPVLYDFLQQVITGNEVPISILASQAISNVPAALLLSGFTNDYAGLIVGTNLGGLGTLIASMASLISYKYIAREDSGRKGTYFVYFTAANICFLAILVIVYMVI